MATGDELILPMTIEAKEKTPSKRTWRDVDREEAIDRKRRENRGRDLRNADAGERISRMRLMADWSSGPP